MHACRRLDCLTHLTLVCTEVKMDALLHISRKVVELDLSESLMHAEHCAASVLHAGDRAASAPDIFNGHWPALVVLDLSGATLAARRLGIVDLPALDHLRVEGFQCWLRGSSFAVQPSSFAAGCPTCSTVTLHLHRNAVFQEGPGWQCDCSGFLNVSSVHVCLDPAKLARELVEQGDFPLRLPVLLEVLPMPDLVLPQSVRQTLVMPDRWSGGVQSREKLNMAAVLMLAQSCIAGGVQLDELWAMGCNSCGGLTEPAGDGSGAGDGPCADSDASAEEAAADGAFHFLSSDSDADESFLVGGSFENDSSAGHSPENDEGAPCLRALEPNTSEYGLHYKQVCERMHGLEFLNLLHSPDIKQRAIDCMVAAMPDVAKLHADLVLSWSLEDTWVFLGSCP